MFGPTSALRVSVLQPDLTDRIKIEQTSGCQSKFSYGKIMLSTTRKRKVQPNSVQPTDLPRKTIMKMNPNVVSAASLSNHYPPTIQPGSRLLITHQSSL